MKADNDKTICVLPWMHLFISEIGDVYPCCVTPESNKPNHFASGQKVRPDQVDRIDDIFNTPYMKDIRAEMLAGKKPSICSRCYKMEEAGLSTHRQASNELFQDFYKDLLAHPTPDDGAIETKLMSIDLRLGNDCNLKCRMCSPFSSHSLVKEFSELDPDKADFYKTLKNIDWYKSDKFIDLIKNSKDLVKLHIAGGEPLITKEHKSLLHKIIQSSCASQVHLTYNTNLTSLPEEVLNLWKSFQGVSVMVSLDGVEDINGYIRYPAKWEDIKTNMLRLESAVGINFTYLTVNTTVQIYNIYNLTELFQFLNDETKKFDLPVLSPLYYPQEFSIQVLPSAAKEKATKFLTDYLKSMRSRLSRFSPHSLDRVGSGVEGLIYFMNEKDMTSLLPEFWRKTRFFDASRSQSFDDLYDSKTFCPKNKLVSN